MHELHDRPALHEPVLIMCLEGWIDAGYAAGTAAQTLLTSCGAGAYFLLAALVVAQLAAAHALPGAPP